MGGVGESPESAGRTVDVEVAVAREDVLAGVGKIGNPQEMK